MGADRCYAWEREKFPWHRGVSIRLKYRSLLTQKLARAFGIRGLTVTLNRRSWAFAHGSSWIELPGEGHRCSLGMICHEIAHLVNFQDHGGRGHTGTFKKTVIKVYVETRVMRLLPPIFAEIRKELAEKRLKSEREAAAITRREQRVLDARSLRKTPGWRLQHALDRVRRLETRIKRLTTMKKKAERQARTLERSMAKRVSQSSGSDTPVPESDHS